MTFVLNIYIYISNNKLVITTKWIFVTKRNKNNNISKFKVCLVACGFTQKYGKDFD